MPDDCEDTALRGGAPASDKPSLNTGSSCPSEYDGESDSSSIVYDHEPFTTFKERVRTFTQRSIWPDTTPNQKIAIERLKGGGFNRIIGLSLETDEPDQMTTIRYILRIPRFDAAQVDRDVAALEFIRQHTRIAAPRVVKYDATEHNELNSPYMVQNRINGTDLFSVYPQLDHGARCRVAKDLGDVFRQMLAVRSSAPGRLALSKNDKNKHGGSQLQVVPFKPTKSSTPTPYSSAFGVQSVHEMLTGTFQAFKEDASRRDPGNIAALQLMDEFSEMTTDLSTDGWLDDTSYTLAHLDLAPRNILLDPTRSPDEPIISAILDWDSAVLAPKFMSCTPPLWLWAWKEDEDEDERTANDTPSTPEACQLKRIFEDAAGKDYIKFAYKPTYRLARQLVRFAIDGVQSNEEFKEAKMMLQEWQSIRLEISTSSPTASHDELRLGNANGKANEKANKDLFGVRIFKSIVENVRWCIQRIISVIPKWLKRKSYRHRKPN